MDRQISAGWMHSGYPIMGPEEASWDALLDLDTLSVAGSWGPFHELGHNFQYSPWVLPGTTETTCNLWSLYLFEQLGATIHGAAAVAERPARIAAYLATGPDFAQWKVWTALDTYVQLKEGFGWGLYGAVFAGYRARSYGSLSDSEKIDEWAKRSAEAANADLGAFYTDWGLPLSPATLAELGARPAWAAYSMSNAAAASRRRSGGPRAGHRGSRGAMPESDSNCVPAASIGVLAGSPRELVCYEEER